MLLQGDRVLTPTLVIEESADWDGRLTHDIGRVPRWLRGFYTCSQPPLPALHHPSQFVNGPPNGDMIAAFSPVNSWRPRFRQDDEWLPSAWIQSPLKPRTGRLSLFPCPPFMVSTEDVFTSATKVTVKEKTKC